MRGPTTEHGEIRRWAEETGASPVELSQQTFDCKPTMLSFIFGDAGDENIRPISWESFFASFDLLGLALVYDGPDPTRYELRQIEERSAYRFEGKPI